MKKRVLITGSSRGIGKAIALYLAAKGYHIVLHCVKNIEQLKEVHNSILQTGGSADMLTFDISDREKTRSILQEDMEKNGVYFMDEDVLKNHEVLHYDSKRYFQIDGLIVDIETNQVINLAGVDKIKEEALLNQIKDKKLTTIKTKGVCVLMADGKEIAFVKEGRSLSTFEILARKKGKQYAENLRSADSTLFEIPDLIDVVQYADNSIDSSLISYLKSLKPKTEEKTKSDLDPIAHLFMAGYVPCFSHELTEKYTKWVNELVPVQVDDEGNHLVAVPQEIAVMLAKKYRRDKKEKLARIKRCDIESISDLDCLIVTSEDEKNMIRPYYRSDEEICTLKDPTRHEIKYMINAVKRNVADIKRENFKKIRREDEYGTSVISIQVSRNGGDISIKNRYNHTLNRETGENPDNTFNSNPDLISEGLSSALRQELGVDFYTTIVEIPYRYVRFGRCLFHYEHEVYGVCAAICVCAYKSHRVYRAEHHRFCRCDNLQKEILKKR